MAYSAGARVEQQPLPESSDDWDWAIDPRAETQQMEPVEETPHSVVFKRPEEPEGFWCKLATLSCLVMCVLLLALILVHLAFRTD